MKNLSKSFIVLFLLFSSSAAFSDLRSDTDRLLNWAEDSYPELFSQTADTQTADFSGAEWCFRAYTGNIFAGVVCESGGGYIQGNVYTYINNKLHNHGSINQFRSAFENHRSDTDRLLNWAEDSYPELFSQTADTQTADFSGAGWCFRAYPGNVFAGVVCESGSGFIQGDVYTYKNNELHNYGSINQFRSAFENHSAVDSPGSGSCINIPFTALEGVIETLRMTVKSAQVSQDITHINEYVSITNTSSATKVTTSNIIGLGEKTESIVTENYQIHENYLYPSSNVSTITTDIITGTESTTTTTITISPPYKSRPVNTVCAGQTWTANAYSETTNGTISVAGFTSDIGSTTTQMPGYTGVVTSINQSVTVPAGTFNTVQLDYTMTNGDTTTSWVTTDIGATVKMNITSTVDGKIYTINTELLSLQK